jgi:hypothetical protein
MTKAGSRGEQRPGHIGSAKQDIPMPRNTPAGFLLEFTRQKAQVSSGFLCSDMLAGTTSTPLGNNQAKLVPCTSNPSTTTA